jgi:hypothetical protein
MPMRSFAISADRLEREIGGFSAAILEQLKDSLAFALDLKRASDEDC